jgi:hypothetical protein
MGKSRSPTTPSRPTVKRLFALSGNRCAYPACPTRLVDRDTGSVVGEVCHIKGEKPSAPRYDAVRSDRDRHGFGNLILLCNVHHKVIDDRPDEYPVERLVAMKQEHETRTDGKEFIDEATSKTFASAAMKFFLMNGSVINATNVSGGQFAHSITNNYAAPQNDGPVQLEGHITIATGMGIFGCPFLELMVVCRSKRPAKIKEATLCLVGKGFMAGVEGGVGNTLGYVPVPGMDEEELSVALFPNRRPTCSDGFVLERDDVIKFAYPIYAGFAGLCLDYPHNATSLRVKFFDNSEQTVAEGKDVVPMLSDLMGLAKKANCTPRFPPVEIRVKVNTAALSEDLLSMEGKVNPNPVAFRPNPNPGEA